MRLAGWWWGCLPWERQEIAFPAKSTSRSRSMNIYIHTYSHAMTWLIRCASISGFFLGHFLFTPSPVYVLRISVLVQGFCKKLP